MSGVAIPEIASGCLIDLIDMPKSDSLTKAKDRIYRLKLAVLRRRNEVRDVKHVRIGNIVSALRLGKRSVFFQSAAIVADDVHIRQIQRIP